jgi:hypothetical protein
VDTPVSGTSFGEQTLPECLTLSLAKSLQKLWNSFRTRRSDACSLSLLCFRLPMLISTSSKGCKRSLSGPDIVRSSSMKTLGPNQSLVLHHSPIETLRGELIHLRRHPVIDHHQDQLLDLLQWESEIEWTSIHQDPFLPHILNWMKHHQTYEVWSKEYSYRYFGMTQDCIRLA